MTEPSQYFKGRTVQEQMNEVIGYVDARAEEVAAAKADDVLQPAEDAKDAAIQAKDDAQAAQAAAEQAVTDAAGVLANAVKKTGESSQSIAGDIVVAGNLTGGTVTVPAPVNNTDATNKKYVDDADALKANKTYVDAQDALKINITDINNYAVGLTGNQPAIIGTKTFTSFISLVQKATDIDTTVKPTANQFKPFLLLKDKNDQNLVVATYFKAASASDGANIDIGSNNVNVRLHVEINPDGGGLLQFITPKGTVTLADTR